MNYSQLEAFVDLVETTSFSQTAHRLSVSQPAITQRIHALEKSLGCDLFERNGDTLTVTQAGNYLYLQGKAMIAMWEKTNLHIQEIKDSPHGSLKMGASTIPSQFFISPLLKDFRRLYPHIQLKVQVAGTDQVVQWLFDKQIDVGIVGSRPSNSKGLSVFPVATDELQLIVPICHPWATKSSIALSELSDSTFIMREQFSGTRKILQEALATRAIDLDSLSTLGEFGSTDAVIAAVECGLGVSFVSKMAAERSIYMHKVRAIPINNFRIERNLYCVMNTNHSSLETIKFSDFIKNHLQGEIHEVQK